MSAAAKLDTAPDPFAPVRVLNKMRAAGFDVRVAGDSLRIAPIDRLSDSQRAYIRSHKPALVALLSDAEDLHRALVEAGPAGLGWREGTPADWDDARLLAAGEVLYADGRMVNRNERRYCPMSAPAIAEGPEYPPPAESPEIASYAAVAPPSNVTPIDRPVPDPLADELATLADLDVGRMLRGELRTDEEWAAFVAGLKKLNERHPDKSDELTALVERVNTAAEKSAP